jgi:hypothetical protein
MGVMDAEMIAYLDKHFGGLQQQVADLRGEMTRRFEQMEDKVHQAHILIEDLRDKIHLIAEGFMGLHEKLDCYRNESIASFEQVRGWIEPYYRILDGRIRAMETRAERQDGDVLDAVRKFLGKPPLRTPQT